MTQPLADTDAPTEEADGMGANVFISYSRADQPFVRRLDAALCRTGRRTWVDWQDIPPSAVWIEEIRAAIEAADAFLFVMSPDSIESSVCLEEIDHALRHNKRIMPVVWRDVSGDVPPHVAARNWIFFRTNDDFEAALNALVRALDTDLDWVRTHTRLLVRAIEWEGARRDRSFALRGTDLRAAEEWLVLGGADKEPAPTALQTQYVIESRREVSRSQRARVATLSVGAIVAVGLAIFAFIQWARAEQEAKVANSRELAASAISQAPTDQELGLLLAIESAKRAPTAQAEAALRQALTQYYPRFVLGGHTRSVTAATFSPDSTRVVTTSADGTARIWDAATGESTATLRHRGRVNVAAFSFDGTLVATGDADGAARVWNADSGKLVAVMQRVVAVTALTFTPDDRRLVTVDANSAVRTWTFRKRDSPLATLRLRGQVLDIDPEGDRILSFGGGTWRVWSVQTGQVIATLRGPRRNATFGAFSPDGTQVATGAYGGPARLWNPATGAVLSEVPGHYGDVAFSPDSDRLVLSARTMSVVWNVRSREVLAILRGHQDLVFSLQFSSDGSRVLSVSTDETARVWDAETGEQLAVLPGPPEPRGFAFRRWIAVFSPDGQRVLTERHARSFRLWQVGSGELLSVLPNMGRGVSTAQFSADGTRVLTTSVDGRARIWDPSAERLLLFPPARAEGFVTSGISSIIVSHNGNEVASLGRDGTIRVRNAGHSGYRILRGDWGTFEGVVREDFGQRFAFADDGIRFLYRTPNSIQVWNATNGELLATKPAEFATPVEVISPNGEWVLTVDRDDIGRVWNAIDGMHAVRFDVSVPVPLISEVTFAPDGSSVMVVPPDGAARAWTTATGRELPEFGGHNGQITHAAFSPDGNQVVTANSDGTAQVWDADTGDAVAVLRGHTSWLTNAAFSPDAKWVVTTSLDGTARVWDAATGDTLEILHADVRSVNVATFNLQGDLIVTAGADGTTRVFRCELCGSIEHLVGLARGRVTRSLTDEEQARYLHET